VFIWHRLASPCSRTCWAAPRRVNASIRGEAVDNGKAARCRTEPRRGVRLPIPPGEARKPA
jgi:hypothetical protein